MIPDAGMRWQLSGLLLILLLALFGYTSESLAQEDVSFQSVQVNYIFAEEMTFSARITPSTAPLRSVTLFLQSEGEPQTRVYQFEPNADGQYRFHLPLEQIHLRPFSAQTFWFAAEMENGATVLSPRQTFSYDDNRFPWQTLRSERLVISWYAGDAAYGQAALDVASETLRRMQSVTPWVDGPPLRVYLYASYEDLAALLTDDAPLWTGSHAYPPLGIALAVVPPGLEQRSAMEQQIPHEVMHLLIYRFASGDYENLPLWLREGLASQAEVHANPAYKQALQSASSSGAILPLGDLCQTFPLDSGRAFLAYAESDSFVRWLRTRYGDAALQDLMHAYADGLDCRQGVWHALGASLDFLEYRWREDVLGEHAWQVALRALGPYLLLLLGILLVPLWQFFLIQEAE